MASHVTRHKLDSMFMETFAVPQAYIPDGLMERDLPIMEVDSLPLMTRPVPSAAKLATDIGSLMEPALCVTPEKSRAKMSLNARKNRPHVRFDPKVTVELHSTESLQGSSSSVADSDSETMHGKTDSVITLQAPANLDETLEPISIMAADLKLEDAAGDGPSTCEVRELVDSADCVLASPEMHTTLWLDRGAKQVQEDGLDVPAAIRQKLKECSRTRSEIIEKACSKVNVETDQFCQLPSLEVCETDLLHATETAAKVRHSHKGKSFKDESTAGEEPDIMSMFSRNFEKETASYNIEALPSLKEGPTTVDLVRAFDVYKHIRSWEGW